MHYFIATPSLTCSVRTGLQASAVRRAQRMRCEFLISLPTLLPEGEGIKSPLPLGEGQGEGGPISPQQVQSLHKAK